MASKITWKKDDLGAYWTELDGETITITRNVDPTRWKGHNWEVVVLQPYYYVGAAATLAEAKALIS